jgi:hypothetical protein
MRLWLAFAVFCGACFGQAEATVSGRVTDALTHLPIAGASVQFMGKTGGRVDTDANGAYLLRLTPDARMSVIWIRKDGYGGRAPLIRRIEVAPGATVKADFELKPWAQISGRLLDRDTGKPLARFVVILVSKGYRRDHVTSQADGSFGFEQESGEYTLEVDPPAVNRIKTGEEKPEDTGYGLYWFPGVSRAEMAVPIRLAPGEKRTMELKLEKRHLPHIAGEFEALKGQEDDVITVRLFGEKATFPVVEGQLDQAGKFRIDGLDAGKYTLVATTIPVGGADHTYSTLTFELTDHSLEDMKIRMRPGVTVRATFRMDEDGVSVPKGVRLLLSPFSKGRTEQGPDEGGLVATDVAPGEYWPRRVAPKGYALVSTACNGRPVAHTTLDLESAESTIEFVLTSQPGLVTGTARDRDQQTVARAKVLLAPDPLPDDLERFDRAELRTAEADDNGAFVFRDLPPGRYRLVTGDEDDVDLAALRALMSGSEKVEVAKGQTVSVDVRVR